MRERWWRHDVDDGLDSRLDRPRGTGAGLAGVVLQVSKQKVVLVCGGRKFTNATRISVVLQTRIPDDSLIVTGGAPGADTVADNLARLLGFDRVIYPANWVKRAVRAGPMRNAFMLKHAQPDLVLAFPDKESKGTWDMVRRAQKAKIEVEVYEP